MAELTEESKELILDVLEDEFNNINTGNVDMGNIIDAHKYLMQIEQAKKEIKAIKEVK